MSIKRNSIYPTMPSLDTVILKAYSELPITDKNQLYDYYDLPQHIT